jgi:phage terminase large subunit-like protein
MLIGDALRRAQAGDPSLDPELLQYWKRSVARIEVANYKKAHKREFPPDWYDWQMQSFRTTKSQIMLMAANRSGKTMSAGWHVAVDATGDYPDWWEGHEFDHGIHCLCMGVDNTQLVDVIQKELFGTVRDKQFSGGWIHPHEIIWVEWSAQVTGLAKRVHIKGKRGTSTIVLRAYTQARTGSATLSFAGTSIDLIWIDECPPDELIGQLVVRTMTGDLGRGGRLRYTLTPELGYTQLVTNFLEDRKKHQELIGPIEWKDCPHLTPELQEEMLASIPPHEREMRSKGVPFIGSGMVFPVPESKIICEPFDVSQKPWLHMIKAIDIGIDHPTAIVWVAFDPNDGTHYVVKCYAMSGEIISTHAAVAKGMFPDAPTVFPHDIDKRDPGSGKTARDYYGQAGLLNTLQFSNPDGSIHTEIGIAYLLELMRTDKFKVFSDQSLFFREFRLYHRKNGKIVPLNDDIMDATRYATVMASRYAYPMAGLHDTPKVKRAM